MAQNRDASRRPTPKRPGVPPRSPQARPPQGSRPVVPPPPPPRRPHPTPPPAVGNYAPPHPQQRPISPVTVAYGTVSAPYDSTSCNPEAVDTLGGNPQDMPPQSVAPSGGFSRKLAKNWPFWSLTALAVVGVVGILSAVSLFRIPNLPNCRAIFWPTASATTRIQCAQAYAEQGTVEGYLEAIALVEKLPGDHPLRSEINQRVEDWAGQILALAEESFQAGDLDKAIDSARRIPPQTAAANLVNEQVNTWKQIWEEAEAIYEASLADVKQQNFREAFAKAIQLLHVGNRHWETTKYEELTDLITAAREDLNQLGQARRLGKEGTLESFRKALEIVGKIQPSSPMYEEAQALIKELGGDMLDLAEASLDRRDAKTANEVLQEIPEQAQLGEQVADMRILVQAAELSWQGGVAGLEGAIARLQSIGQDRPLYARAQEMMRRWQVEIEGRSHLDWARRIAEPGTVADLQAAIAEAEKVSRENPVWEEAQDQIDTWQTRVETIQDRPYLDQAAQLAQAGNLPEAIAMAERVQAGRALYGEAQGQIRKWREQIERAEDGPYLEQAEQLADVGRLSEAIAMASQIRPGRVLYDDAQAAIEGWRNQIEGQQKLQSAYQVAQQGTVDALAQAIAIARDVPEDSPQSTEAEQAVTRWSWDLLRLAETAAQYSNWSQAIAIAQKVPTQTEAYAPAQLKIQEWQSILDPTAGSTEDTTP